MPAKKDATKKDEAKKDEKPATIKVIAIADLDLISEQFFELRRRKVENLDFDNVTFVLNCVDVLAGDESFVALRKKRPEPPHPGNARGPEQEVHRGAPGQTKAAEDAAKEQLDQAQKAFDKQVEQVKSRTDFDERTKEIMLQQPPGRRPAPARRREANDRGPEAEPDSRGQGRLRAEDPGHPERRPLHGRRHPSPAPLILGLMVFIGRLRRENLGANPTGWRSNLRLQVPNGNHRWRDDAMTDGECKSQTVDGVARLRPDVR